MEKPLMLFLCPDDDECFCLFRFPIKEDTDDDTTTVKKRGRGRPPKYKPPSNNNITRILIQEAASGNETILQLETMDGETPSMADIMSKVTAAAAGAGAGGDMPTIIQLDTEDIHEQQQQTEANTAAANIQAQVPSPVVESDRGKGAEESSGMQMIRLDKDSDESAQGQSLSGLPAEVVPGQESSKKTSHLSDIQVEKLQIVSIKQDAGGKTVIEQCKDNVLSHLEALKNTSFSKLEQQGVKVIKIKTDSKETSEGNIVLSDLTDKTFEEVKQALQQQEEFSVAKPKRLPTVKVSPDKISGKVDDIPVFTNEADKAQFDQALNVDISIVDSLFSTHIISQELNENAPPTTPHTADTLTVYSCSHCQRVFMSLSQARTHALIHTDYRPYRCFKCPYTTNTKGNLYSHMRRHTGQMYACDHCPFRTHNKGHLIEHEEIHSTEKHQCRICRKSYSTTKSLANHVKRYHANTPRGRQYAAQFAKRKKQGPPMLHMCHVSTYYIYMTTNDIILIIYHHLSPPTVMSSCLFSHPPLFSSQLFLLFVCFFHNKHLFQAILINSK